MERHLTELITGLLEAGTRVRVISWTCRLPAHPGLRWHRVPGPSRPFSIGYPCFLVLASLLVWLRGRGPVHSTGAVVLNRASIRTIHLCHHAVAELAEYSRASKPGLAHRVNTKLPGAMSRLAERWCYHPRRSDLLVGVSEGVAREIRRHFPRMKDRVAVVPNGVDTETFHPRDR